MVEINKLTQLSTVSDGDLFPFWPQAQGSAFSIPASVIAAYVNALSTSNAEKVTQYAAPSASAFNVSINSAATATASNSVYLILAPTGTFAAGTITLPLSTSLKDKQELLVSCTQIVTALTVAGNGAGVVGAPTTLAANGFFRLRYDAVFNNWYRVG